MNYTYCKNIKMLRIITALCIICIMVNLKINVRAEDSASSTDTEIIVTATDDNTSQDKLKYAINSNDESAFSSDNIFKVKKGEGYVIYVKDLAGNITSKIVNVSNTGQVTTETDNKESKKSSSSKSSDSKGTTIINVSPYDNSNITKGTSNTTGNEAVTTASGSGSGTGSTGTDTNSDLSDALKGEGTVLEESREYISGTEGGKEFYTIQTKDEHVFYLVVDHDQNEENVYFLDTVTEQDMLSLASSESESKSNSIFGNKTNTDSEEESDFLEGNDEKKDTVTKEQTTSNSTMSKLPLVLFIGIIGGGIYYFLKKKKQKKMLDDADDIEDFEGTDDKDQLAIKESDFDDDEVADRKAADIHSDKQSENEMEEDDLQEETFKGFSAMDEDEEEDYE